MRTTGIWDSEFGTSPRRQAGGPVPPQPRRGEGGFSLLEVIIASVILTLVILMTIQVMIVGQNAYNRQSTLSECQERSRRFLEDIVDELPGANGTTLTIGNQHSLIEFAVPIDFDGDGDVLAADRITIEYGAKNGAAFVLNGKIRYQFVQESVVTETTDSIDHNNNGALSGSFARGRIDRSILNSSGGVIANTTTTIARNVMLRSSPLDGDVTGDGQNDALFMRISGFGAGGVPTENAVSGNQVLVNITHARLDANRLPSIASARTVYRLRNVP